MYDSDGVKSSTRDSDAEIEDSDGSRSTRASSRSSNSHSSRRQTQIQQAASVRQAQQLASNTSANSKHQLPVIQYWGWIAEQRNPRAFQELQEHQSWVPFAQVLREELRQDLRTRRREKSPFHTTRAWIHVEASDAIAQVLTQGRQGEQSQVCQITAVSGKGTPQTPKHQPANDSEDDSNSSIGSDSSMSVEVAPRSLIWRNDTSSSKKGRKVSHLRNVSTIHSVRKSRRLSEKRDNDKPDAKASSEPEAVVPQAGQTALAARVAPDITTSRHSGDEARRMEEEYHGYSQEEPRPRFENLHKSTPHLNPRGTEFESIRLATRIEEWYRNCVPDEELTELPAQKGILRISDTEKAVQLSCL